MGGFTGQLGTPDSQLGRISLGTPSAVVTAPQQGSGGHGWRVPRRRVRPHIRAVLHGVLAAPHAHLVAGSATSATLCGTLARPTAHLAAQQTTDSRLAGAVMPLRGAVHAEIAITGRLGTSEKHARYAAYLLTLEARRDDLEVLLLTHAS